MFPFLFSSSPFQPYTLSMWSYTTDIIIGLVSWLKRPAQNFTNSFYDLHSLSGLRYSLFSQPKIQTSKNDISLNNPAIPLNCKKGGEDKCVASKGLVLPIAVFLVQLQ